MKVSYLFEDQFHLEPMIANERRKNRLELESLLYVMRKDI